MILLNVSQWMNDLCLPTSLYRIGYVAHISDVISQIRGMGCVCDGAILLLINSLIG